MKYIKKVLGEDLRQYTMVVALAALIIIFNIASGGKMVTSSNFQNLISGNAYVLVLALGMLMVIVIGQIDLSVGSVAGFASMVMAITARQFNLPWYIAKPTNALVAETVSIIDSLMSGNGMPATDVKADNGVMEVPVYELPPVVVTKDNAKEVFADDPDRLALLKD